MSILIKGVDMPKNCMECPVNTLCYKATVDITSDVPSNVKADWITGRANWCPIVEIPTPHGDLIDKNDMRESLRSLMWYDEDGSESELEPWLEEDIMNVPTVIESEE